MKAEIILKYCDRGISYGMKASSKKPCHVKHWSAVWGVSYDSV